ncbi:hypothetical protein HYU09_03210 [Candidatus Woesearchaeota archaeon]|nr:hypothetical protein [Candidatus Woesearchaeota archaeon]
MRGLGSKGSTGINWYALAIATIASIGIILFYYPVQASIPEVGEFPAKLAKSLEETRNKDQVISTMLERIFEQSLASVAGSGIFASNTKCGSYLEYSIIMMPGQDCIGSFDLRQELINLFQESYSGLKKSKIGDIDFSNIDFDVSIDNGFIAKSTGRIPFRILEDKGSEAVAYVDPSFYTSIGYDLDEHKKIQEKAQRLFGFCKDSENKAFCTASNKASFFNDDDFRLLDKCDPDENENFYKVSEYIESCSYSDDNSCICTKNNPSIKGSYDVTQNGNDILIASKINPELRQTIKNANLADNYVYIGDASFVHKDNDGKVIISGYWTGKTCEPKPQTKFRFCVQSIKSNIYAYDEKDKTTKLRPVVYKFALDFKESSGNDILEGSAGNDVLGSSDIKERIKLVASEIGFTNVDLALKLAKTESNFQHCNDKSLNCGTANSQNVLTNGKDFGVMQINTDAHSDLFTPGAQRLGLFACKEVETVYDLDCNIKSGLKILQQNYNAYGFNTERYNNAVDEFCKDNANNAKYKSYTDPWDRALRAYNGFGCNVQVAGYVEKVDSAIV